MALGLPFHIPSHSPLPHSHSGMQIPPVACAISYQTVGERFLGYCDSLLDPWRVLRSHVIRLAPVPLAYPLRGIRLHRTYRSPPTYCISDAVRLRWGLPFAPVWGNNRIAPVLQSDPEFRMCQEHILCFGDACSPSLPFCADAGNNFAPNPIAQNPLPPGTRHVAQDLAFARLCSRDQIPLPVLMQHTA